MILAIGPCMFAAPLVAVAFIIAIPLWPVGLVLMLVASAITWPMERLCRLVGIRALDGASAFVWHWTVWYAKPLNWLDAKPKPPSGSGE